MHRVGIHDKAGGCAAAGTCIAAGTAIAETDSATIESGPKYERRGDAGVHLCPIGVGADDIVIRYGVTDTEATIFVRNDLEGHIRKFEDRFELNRGATNVTHIGIGDVGIAQGRPRRLGNKVPVREYVTI